MKAITCILVTMVALIPYALGYGQSQGQKKDVPKETSSASDTAVKATSDKWEIEVEPLIGVSEWDFYVEQGKGGTISRILGRRSVDKGHYILRLWVEFVNRQKTNATLRLKDVSLKCANEALRPYAYAEPREVAVAPSRDISLPIPPSRKTTYILFFDAPRDVQEFSLSILDLPAIKLKRPELPESESGQKK